MEPLAITLDDVLAARERLRGKVYESPCPRSEMLSQLTGQQVFLKLENLQMTGSFKERGALNKLALLSAAESARGVVAASAGNHAQGVAYHATRLGIRSVIVMPLATPLVKVTATRGFGAEVMLYGSNYDEACAEATRLCESEGMVFLHPFDDPAVMAGQGTIALEMLEQIPGLEAVLVPIGGGGLIGGMACALKQIRPSVRVIGVQTSRLPSMVAALAHHGPTTVEAGTTIADGIAVRRAGSVTFPVVAQFVDEIVTVDEDEIASAILLLLEREKTLAEGAGAAALAALLQRKSSLARRTGVHTGVLVCGGNIDVTLLARIIERGLVQDGRMIRLRIHLLDKPGALAELTEVIASHRVNIVDTLYNRAYYGVNLGDTAIDITLETRGREQAAELLAALSAQGYRHTRVQWRYALSVLPSPISSASAAHYVWGDGCDGWHLVRHAALSVIEEGMPPGTAERRHSHARALQFFFVLSGVLSIQVEGETHLLHPHQGLEIAPGLAHQVANRGADPARFLVISQPPSHGDRTDV